MIIFTFLGYSLLLVVAVILLVFSFFMVRETISDLKTVKKINLKKLLFNIVSAILTLAVFVAMLIAAVYLTNGNKPTGIAEQLGYIVFVYTPTFVTWLLSRLLENRLF